MRFHEFKLTEAFVIGVPSGRKGPEIANIQKALVALGYDIGPTGVDGVRGPYTDTAVKAFQTANKLTVDGDPGPETVKLLNQTLAASPEIANKLTPSTVADVKGSVKKAPLQPLAQDAVTQGKVGDVLNLIAQYESGGNYNILHGGKVDPNLSRMTIAQVFQLQDQMRSQGHESTAVGRYQFIKSTLMECVKGLQLNPDRAIFDPKTQDDLIIYRLRSMRGLDSWLSGNMDDATFLENLAKEFASMPAPSKQGGSYYAGIGSNKAGVNMSQALASLQNIKSGDVA